MAKIMSGVNVDASASNLLSVGWDFLDRLDENYLFLLNFVESSLTGLSIDHSYLAKQWLTKIGTVGTDPNSEADKLKRNSYLAKLITCMQEKHFTGIFANLPNKDPLPEEEWTFPHYTETPKVLQEIINREATRIKVGGKNFETYVSTKMFENGRGSCAYVAVSVKNEGDKKAWTKMKIPNKHEEIKKLYQTEIGKKFDKKATKKEVEGSHLTDVSEKTDVSDVSVK